MNNTQPNRFAFRILQKFCPPQLLEEIEGDLMQRYERDVQKLGEQPAARRLVWNTIRFLRPGILLRHTTQHPHNPFMMLPHFLKIFFRSSIKSASYSFINIAGLAVGMACSIIALLWITAELSFDQFHEHRANLYSIRTHLTSTDGVSTFPNTPGRLAEELKTFPEVEESCRTVANGPVLFNFQGSSFFEDGIYADESLFTLFTFQFVEGNAADPFPDASSVIITERLALKHFGNERALGKMIRVNGNLDVQVTGVIRDLPAPSTLQFTAVLPYTHYAKQDPYNQEWGAWTGGNTYVKLAAGSNVAALNKKIDSQITRTKIWSRWGDNVALSLFAMDDWHLKRFENGVLVEGKSNYLKGFALIAGLILIIASVNFMNLATARSMSRMKEIGVRKVIGAARTAITKQFIGESMLLSLFSLVVAIVLAHLFIPRFNTITQAHISIDYANPLFWVGVISIAVFTALMAGSYPALFLSSRRAIHILKGTLPRFTGGGIRKALVVFQFSTSVVLVICAIAIYRQIEYMREKDLGFDKENVFYLNASSNLIKNYDVFRQKLLATPGIQSIGRASDEPMNVGTGLDMGDDAWRGKTKEDNTIFKWLFCDEDFLNNFRFDLKEGRHFSSGVAADSANFIITEEAARKMRFAEPIGEKLKIDRTGSIIGVVKDFHSAGLSQPILPVIISMRPERATRIFIRYEKNQLTPVLNQVKKEYKQLESEFPLEYFFMDDAFNRVYQEEIQVGQLTTAFMAIALFISCLGLFALSSYTAEGRIKELGIRKILGATSSQLVVLLCRDIMQLIVLALLVAFPFAWWMGNKFLEKYAFRTEFGAQPFLYTSFALVALALITVAWQSIRAAASNPVNNLRRE